MYNLPFTYVHMYAYNLDNFFSSFIVYYKIGERRQSISKKLVMKIYLIFLFFR